MKILFIFLRLYVIRMLFYLYENSYILFWKYCTYYAIRIFIWTTLIPKYLPINVIDIYNWNLKFNFPVTSKSKVRNLLTNKYLLFINNTLSHYHIYNITKIYTSLYMMFFEEIKDIIHEKNSTFFMLQV